MGERIIKKVKTGRRRRKKSRPRKDWMERIEEVDASRRKTLNEMKILTRDQTRLKK